jgi:hypothetical protein
MYSEICYERILAEESHTQSNRADPQPTDLLSTYTLSGKVTA